MPHPPDDVDQIIEWLEQHRDEVNGIGFGSVTFHIGNGDIKAERKSVSRLLRPTVERKSA